MAGVGVVSVPSAVTGVRVYKAAANTGTHTGSLWTADGTRLAQATFSSETSSGWQKVTFATPVPLAPARKARSSPPAIPRLQQGDLSEDGTTYVVMTDLDAETPYQIKVAGLVDTFGQRLAKPYEHAFRTGDGRPRLSPRRGASMTPSSRRSQIRKYTS